MKIKNLKQDNKLKEKNNSYYSHNDLNVIDNSDNSKNLKDLMKKPIKMNKKEKAKL